MLKCRYTERESLQVTLDKGPVLQQGAFVMHVKQLF